MHHAVLNIHGDSNIDELVTCAFATTPLLWRSRVSTRDLSKRAALDRTTTMRNVSIMLINNSITRRDLVRDSDVSYL